MKLNVHCELEYIFVCVKRHLLFCRTYFFLERTGILGWIDNFDYTFQKHLLPDISNFCFNFFKLSGFSPSEHYFNLSNICLFFWSGEIVNLTRNATKQRNYQSRLKMALSAPICCSFISLVYSLALKFILFSLNWNGFVYFDIVFHYTLFYHSLFPFSISQLCKEHENFIIV